MALFVLFAFAFFFSFFFSLSFFFFMLKTRENALKDGQVADGDEREDLEEERKGFTHDKDPIMGRYIRQ